MNEPLPKYALVDQRYNTMPPLGLIDETGLDTVQGPLMRARLHIRGAKRRFMRGKISLYDYHPLLNDNGSIMMKLGVMPFDGSKHPPQHPEAE